MPFVCGDTPRVAASRPTEAWWSTQVICSKAEVVSTEGKHTGTERYDCFVDPKLGTLVVKNTFYDLRGPPELLMMCSSSRIITAYIEVRLPMWSHQPDWWITYHSSLLLEVNDGSQYILVERKSDLLEMVVGDHGIPRPVMKALRPSCPARDPFLMREQERVELTSLVTVHDFFNWLDGPLEESWAPYDLLSQNCQHFTSKVKNFLIDPMSSLKRAAPLERVSENLQMDPLYVLSEVKRDWRALKFAREVFRRDREIVLEAVKQDGRAFRYAHECVRTDRATVLAAVANDGSVLPYVEGDLRQDREVVRTAVQQKGLMLSYAGWDLRQDRSLVLSAVRQDGTALRYISTALQWDPEVLLTACMQNPVSAACSAL